MSDAPREVLFDHDGAVDDLVSLALLVRSPSITVRAVTLLPADSYLEPATRSTLLVLDALGARGVSLALGHAEGVNPFPAAWRAAASAMLDIEALAGRMPSGANPLEAESAAQHLVRRLWEGPPCEVLATGPLTNIAEALRLDPTIGGQIRRLWVMGGAVRVPGNVVQAGHDGSAEWNIFNEPVAAAEVIASGVPMTLVPLDATDHVPLTHAFVDRLGALPSAAARLCAQAWRTAVAPEGEDTYYFWDTLTAAALLDPAILRTERMRVKVITEGPSQGRTLEAPDGAWIDVGVHADRETVESRFLEVLGRV